MLDSVLGLGFTWSDLSEIFFRFRSFSDEFCGISVCFQRHCVEMNVYGNLFIIYIYARFKNCLN